MHARRLALFCLSLFIVAPAGASDDIDGIIVRYRAEQKGAALTDRVSSLQDIAAKSGFALSYFRAGGAGVHVVKLDRKVSVAEATLVAKSLAANDPSIEYAEPDLLLRPAFTPNDPRYGEQWHYFEPAAGINLPGAWDLSTGQGVTVAVVDTGYRPHRDLVANVLPGYNFVSGVEQQMELGLRGSDAVDYGDTCWWSFSTWHGTHVAGAIAAVTNNGVGVAGVAFNARILPARVIGRCAGTISDAADAIIWSSGGSVPNVPRNRNPARVINLSMDSLAFVGDVSCANTYQNAINIAIANNSILVTAAGNNSLDAASSAPGNCNGVITVAAVDRAGRKSSYSNFGSVVDVAAPGGEGLGNWPSTGLLSTYNNGTFSWGTDNYQGYSGTSISSALVSGVVALMVSRNPSLTSAQVLQILRANARPLTSPCTPACNFGIVDAAASVRAVAAFTK